MISFPTVTLLAKTELAPAALELMPYFENDVAPPGGHVCEFGGRACYQSWNRPNALTATNEGYLKHIIDVGHLSVLSHGGVTFYLTGISRSLSHELVRHIFLGKSQLSQRYVGGDALDWVCPPNYLDNDSARDIVHDSFMAAVQDYEKLARAELLRLAETGMNGRDARIASRQAARAVLPNSTETRMVLSGNYRAWRDFLMQRWTPGAEPEIRRLAGVILEQLKAVEPTIFGDIPDDYRLTGVPTLGLDGQRVLFGGGLYETIPDFKADEDCGQGEGWIKVRKVEL